MKQRSFRLGLLTLLLLSISNCAPITAPDMRTTKPIVLCVDCDQKFDPDTHEKVLKDLLSNTYIGELRKALYWQDSVHQFQSKAHFDNCDFDSATNYIDSLLSETDDHVIAAQKAQNDGDDGDLQAAIRKAFFSIGQALHAIQDFYAHSNYVELMKDSVKRLTDLEVVAPWRPEGKTRIIKLREKGLVSGYVFWGFPQKCSSCSSSHADLAKDSVTTTSGQVKVSHLGNITQYGIAVFLASEASQELLRDAFRQWPLLKELNGPNVAFEVLIDRR
ncbi:MAG: exported protein of unknown function [Nitrospira sp.]|nr:MAG: exported protein of unknown function [Nitrospira sp.]